jgi:membrane fusion protein (multidrug efflux system)
MILFGDIMWWIVAGWMLACQTDDNAEKTEQRDWKPSIPAVLVKTEFVGTDSVADTIEITGVLESIEQVNIIPETTGVVQNIFVREGDLVKKGDPLAKIINTNAKASLERSQIEVDRLQGEWKKAQRLQEGGAISEREFQEINTQLKTAQTSKTEALATQKRSTIRSPIDGVVALVNIREGEVATSTQLFQVVQPDRLRLVASVPERDLTQLKEQQTVDIRAAYNDETNVSGVVERIAPVVDPTTGSVRVFINIEEGQKVLRPGQFVKAQVEVDRHENTIVLPKEAVVYEDGAPIAYVVMDAPPESSKKNDDLTDENDAPEGERNVDETDDENDQENKEGNKEKGLRANKPAYVANRRELTVGFSDARIVEVTEGVSVGEQVITIGNHTLEDNSPITLELNIPKKDSSEDTEGQNDTPSEDLEKAE